MTELSKKSVSKCIENDWILVFVNPFWDLRIGGCWPKEERWFVTACSRISKDKLVFIFPLCCVFQFQIWKFWPKEEFQGGLLCIPAAYCSRIYKRESCSFLQRRKSWNKNVFLPQKVGDMHSALLNFVKSPPRSPSISPHIIGNLIVKAIGTPTPHSTFPYFGEKEAQKRRRATSYKECRRKKKI